MRGKLRKASLAVFTATALVFAFGCAPKSAPQQSTQSQTSTMFEFVWSESSDCSVCHEQQCESMEDSDCLASKHGSLSCGSCHADTAILGKVHEGVDPAAEAKATRLKKTSVDIALCQSCHGSLADLAEKTQSSTVCTDSNGTVVNPHALPENEEHSDIDCSSCHFMHDEKAVTEQVKNLCSSCHHENVYECFTCHA